MEYITDHRARYYSSRGEHIPKMIVIHATGGSYQGDILTLSGKTSRKVSVHYYITRTGQVFQMLDESLCAFHAGVSKWKGLEVFEWRRWSVNKTSIGIELENNGAQEYTDEQYESLIFLLKDIRARWEIGKEEIVGHRDVSPRRKIDPYDSFNWLRVRQGVFGGDFPEWANEGVYWCKKHGIMSKITGEPMPDYRLAVLLYRYSKLIDKKIEMMKRLNKSK